MKYVKLSDGRKIIIAELGGANITRGTSSIFGAYSYNGLNSGYYFAKLGTPLHTVFSLNDPVGTKYFLEDGSYFIISSIHIADSKTLGVNLKAVNKVGLVSESEWTIKDPEIARSLGVLNVAEQYLCSFPSISDGIVTTNMNAYILNLPLGIPELLKVYTDPSLFKSPDIFSWIQSNNGTVSANAANHWVMNDFFKKIEVQEEFPGFPSDTGGGGGNFDGDSDNIAFPSLPTNGAINTNMVTLFAPSLLQINDLASYLWTPTFIEAIGKLFQNPLEAIIGLSLVNLTPSVTGIEEIKIGALNTGVSAPKITSQYITLDCGALKVTEYWGNALDYSPYTKIQLYLPFIGVKDLNVDDMMNAEISIKYHIDLLTCGCLAMVSIKKSGFNSVLYNFSGNIGTQIPLSGSNYSQVIANITRTVVSAGVAIGTGGSSAIAQVAASTAMNVVSSKTTVERSGRIDGNVGTMGIKFPYLIISRPIQSLPKNFSQFNGYPSNITVKVSDVSGYLECENFIANNLQCTDDEKMQIKQLLESGVYVL